MKKRLRYGLVGAGLTSFIGSVHRISASFDGFTDLAAGCFSRDSTKNRECGDFLRLDPDRVYDSFEEMAQKESLREDGIDFVTIAAPNDVHYAAAKAFLMHGIHILCEKPLCYTVEEAEELKALAAEHHCLFCVNYSYSGNAMVKEARELVRQGALGEIIDVKAEYLQEYLADDIGQTSKTMNAMSAWRKDPSVAGVSNCVGDIGSHIENTVACITGLRIKRLAAKLDYFGQPLDLNANILIELENGAHGVFSSSQVCIGHRNGFVVRIFGTEGSLEWHEENPGQLIVAKKGQPLQIYDKGMTYISPVAAGMVRIPAGHPEGYYEAFANMYKTWVNAVLKYENGEELTAQDLDFPDIDEGIRGIRFIHACVKSSREDAAWVDVI